MRQFAEIFGINDKHKIVDVGGGTLNWSYISAKPNITIGNIDEEDRDEADFSFRNLDGTQLPFDDRSFDIAYSNSVIEHVGNWEQQLKFANEIRRVAKYYYVQTPNRWFFVEPHFISFFIHFLPRPLFRRLLPLFSVWYWIARPSQQYVEALVEEIQLLNEAQVRGLFPDAEIIKERLLFFTKSFIAVRAPKKIEALEAPISSAP